MTRDINNGMDIIDSRDVIERIKELDISRDAAKVDHDAPVSDPTDQWTSQDETVFTSSWTDDEENEYQALKSLESEAEDYAPDWRYGEALIRDSYFENYARELADDCGMLEHCDKWPATCIDWEKAAEELQQDYTSVDFDGVTYWVRS